MQSLGCVLAATIRGARSSCVLLLVGLTAPESHDVTERPAPFSSLQGGRHAAITYCWRIYEL
jgi:hypothetical protein